MGQKINMDMPNICQTWNDFDFLMLVLSEYSKTCKFSDKTKIQKMIEEFAIEYSMMNTVNMVETTTPRVMR